MCKPASFVVTKTSVLWSKQAESHETILAENKLDDTTTEPDFVRVEITPPDDNYTLPPDQWVFRVDQDYLPKWWVACEDEKRVRAELPKWIAAKVVLPDENKTVTDTSPVFVYGRADLRGNSHADLRDNSHAVLRDNSHAVLRDNSHAVLRDNSHAVLWDNSHAVLRDNSHAVLRDNSHAVLWDNSHADLMDNSHADLRDNSILESIDDYAVAITYTPQPLCALHSIRATIIDQSGEYPVCYTGAGLNSGEYE